MIGRREFLAGLVAAPAVIRLAPLMRLSVSPRPKVLTLADITRAAIRRFNNSNVLLAHANSQYDREFAMEGAKIGTSLRIRLPKDYSIRT